MTLSNTESGALAFPLAMGLGRARLWPAETLHDGISYNAATGRVVLKAPGAAPTITTLSGAFTFTGGNQSRYMGPSGLLVASATNTPRIEYDANGNCLGLLMEASRTNLLLQSAALNTTWTAENSSVTANTATAPDGTTTADAIVENSASTSHRVWQDITVTSGGTYTVSAFVKADTRTFIQLRSGDTTETTFWGVTWNLGTGAMFNTVAGGTGSVTSHTITPLANGWYRVSMTGTAGGAITTARVWLMLHNGSLAVYLGDGGSRALLWGIQAEQAAFASSYIPTTTGSVARTADSCIRTLGSEFSATAGTVVVAGRASGGQDASVGQGVWSFDDGTLNERFCFTRSPATDTGNYIVTDGGVAQALLANTFTNSTAFKAGAAWAANDAAVSFNGNAIQTDATVTLPTVTTLNVGGMILSTQMNGHILRFDYWPSRLANSVLQRLGT